MGRPGRGLHLGPFPVKVTKSVGIARHLVTSRTTVAESVSADLIYLLFMGEASVAFVKNNLLFWGLSIPTCDKEIFEQFSAKSRFMMWSQKIQNNLSRQMCLFWQQRPWLPSERTAAWQNGGNGACT